MKKEFAKGDLQNTKASILPKQLASFKLFQQIWEIAKSMGQSGFAANVLIPVAAALHVEQCLRRIFRILISHPWNVQIKYIEKPQIRIMPSVLVKFYNNELNWAESTISRCLFRWSRISPSFTVSENSFQCSEEAAADYLSLCLYLPPSLKSNFTIVLPRISATPLWTLPFGFPNRTFLHISHPSHMRYMSRPLHHPRFDH